MASQESDGSEDLEHMPLRTASELGGVREPESSGFVASFATHPLVLLHACVCSRNAY